MWLVNHQYSLAKLVDCRDMSSVASNREMLMREFCDDEKHEMLLTLLGRHFQLDCDACTFIEPDKDVRIRLAFWFPLRPDDIPRASGEELAEQAAVIPPWLWGGHNRDWLYARPWLMQIAKHPHFIATSIQLYLPDNGFATLSCGISCRVARIRFYVEKASGALEDFIGPENLVTLTHALVATAIGETQYNDARTAEKFIEHAAELASKDKWIADILRGQDACNAIAMRVFSGAAAAEIAEAIRVGKRRSVDDDDDELSPGFKRIAMERCP